MVGADQRPERISKRRVSFYFSAHQDDWQLFINPPAFQDVVDPATTCIFLHLTAGDAGLGAEAGGRKYPLYIARENGAKNAIRFMADSDCLTPLDPAVSAAAFNGHPIERVNYRNTAAYFLRVPDGSPTGAGYAHTGCQSLQRLAEGQIESLSAIDGTTSYRGWRDLVATLRSIIDFEGGAASSLQFHIPEIDPIVNPNDHSDHLMTARAALDATEGLADCQTIFHVGYASADRPENLSPQERDMQCAVYAVTLAGVLALDHPVAWKHYDRLFVGRSYCQTAGR